MEYLILIVVAVVIVIWRLNKQRDKKEALLFEEYEKAKLSDEAVTKAQTEFEKRLEENADLPDGVRGKEAFIYWNFMRKWFGSLIAVNRYDETKSDKIKRDWLDYLNLLEEKKSLNLLSLEIENDEKRDRYAREADSAAKKIELIENGMVAAIGKEAIEQLEHTRSRDCDAFDRSGKKPMAPIGYHYFPTSIRPYVEECKRSTVD
jgi:hypothetical protein